MYVCIQSLLPQQNFLSIKYSEKRLCPGGESRVRFRRRKAWRVDDATQYSAEISSTEDKSKQRSINHELIVRKPRYNAGFRGFHDWFHQGVIE